MSVLWVAECYYKDQAVSHIEPGQTLQNSFLAASVTVVELYMFAICAQRANATHTVQSSVRRLNHIFYFLSIDVYRTFKVYVFHIGVHTRPSYYFQVLAMADD